MKHKLSKNCQCNPIAISFKANKNTYEVLCSYVRILVKERNVGKVDTCFLEDEAQMLLKRLVKK